MPIVDCGFRDGPLGSGAEILVQRGPILQVNIGLDPEYKYESGSALNSDIMQVPALVDTGAVFSCIDDDLARSLGLPLVDRRLFYMLNGKRECNAYLAHIVVPALSLFQHGIFYGLTLDEIERPYLAVIGRTFLRDMVLIYDGPTGSVRIARQPRGNGAAPQRRVGAPGGTTRP